MAEIRFYLDENLPTAIAHQLRLRGVDCMTVRDLGHLGDWVNFLELMHAIYTSEEMQNRIEFL